MPRFCLALAIDDILVFQMSPLHFSFVVFVYPCLQSMSSRGINCYSILVGCAVASSPPGMQAKTSRAILLTRDSIDEESIWRLTGMVSETLLLDLSLKVLAGSMRKTWFFCVTVQEQITGWVQQRSKEMKQGDIW